MQINTARTIGFWSAIYLAFLGAAYLLLLIYSFATAGFVFPPPPFVQLVGGIVTFLTVPGMVVLFTVIKYARTENNNVLGSLGVSFILLFAATVSINRFVQLTVIQQSLPTPPADLARFLPYASDSVMFALEMLGWGFFSSLAALCVAPLFSGTAKPIRGLFIAYGVFSLISVVGFATNTPIIAAGFVAWGLILEVVVILLARYFRSK